MPRIALVVYALNVGGMETVLLQLALALRRQGCEVTFVVTEAIGPWHAEPRREGFEVREVLPDPRQSRIRHAQRIAESLRGHDACLLNHARFAQGALGLLPASTCAVAVLHNLDEKIFRVGLANARNLDGAVAVGEAVRREASRHVPATFPLRCIPNGIHLPDPVPRPPRDANAPLRLVYLGRVEHGQKGVLYLPAMAEGLRRQGLAFTLDVVGAGPDLPRLSEALAGQLPSSVLRIHGALAPEQAMQVLASSEVLLLPSHFEGMPLVLLEAMARGVVPVASRLEGITDPVIEEGRSGLLVDVGRVEQFVAAIAGLDADPGRLARLSAGALARAHEQFGADRMAERYLAFLGELRERPSARTGTIDEGVLGPGARLPEGLRAAAVRLLKRMGLVTA